MEWTDADADLLILLRCVIYLKCHYYWCFVSVPACCCVVPEVYTFSGFLLTPEPFHSQLLKHSLFLLCVVTFSDQQSTRLASYHAPTIRTATRVSQLLVRVCGTVCRRTHDETLATDCLGDNLTTFPFGRFY